MDLSQRLSDWLVFAIVFAAISIQLTQGQFDGNPHGWDRIRRCDWDYDPPCEPCEGIGGQAYGDKNEEIQIPSCKVVARAEYIDTSSIVHPDWGTAFTLEEGYHEILIGKKEDPFCFEDFPSAISNGTLCYRREEGTLRYDMEQLHAIQLNLNVHIDSFKSNVSSTVLHQGEYMWIANNLWFGVQQCFCFIAVPDIHKNVHIRPHIYPVQFDWTKKAELIGREIIGVEYLWQEMELDHWVLGPHHIWSNPKTGRIVRMWQPFNGLEVLDQTTRKVVNRSKIQIPPPMCKKGGAKFRINCDDEGYPLPCSNKTTGYKNQYCEDISTKQVDKPSIRDIRRAHQRIPGHGFTGEHAAHSWGILNGHLRNSYNFSKECESWRVEDLQKLQVMLLMQRSSDFDEIYQASDDKRRLLHDDMKSLGMQWMELNTHVANHPRMEKMQRDGLCAETVMWFVHHLTEQSRKDIVSSGVHVPLLAESHHTCPSDANSHEMQVCARYHEQVTCATCHSAEYPSTSTL